MKRLLLIVTCVFVAGCAARDFVPSGYSFSPYSGAKFSVNDRVWVHNATPSMVEKVGTNLNSDLRDWGKQLSYGLERSLECRGAKIDRKARKKISVRITHAEVRNKILKYTASMECVVWLGIPAWATYLGVALLTTIVILLITILVLVIKARSS